MVAIPVSPFTQTRTCKTCGKPFDTDDLRVRFCSDGCRPFSREAHAHHMKARRRALPEDQRREIARANYLKYGRASHAKNQTVVCTVCQSIKRRGDAAALEKATFVCGDCKKEQRIKERRERAANGSGSCRSCGGATAFSEKLGRPLVQCADCQGLATRLAEQLGLTRERGRQLIQKEKSRAAVYGDVITAAEAARRVRLIRGIA